MSDKADFWYGKRVLITGGDGFVASNLATSLIGQNANVVVTVRHLRPLATAKLLNVEGPPPDIEYSCDLSNYLAVQQLCNRHQIDTIFHLAASAIVSDASNAPMSTFANNILPTLNLLEATRVNKIPRILIASSDKSYGDHAEFGEPETIPYRENYALRGLDVYSASKVCADMISQTYALQFNLHVMVVRSCNIYGPGDLNFTRLIPRTILRVLRNRSPVIHEGSAQILREYLYIEDVVRAYEFLAQNLERHYEDERPRGGRSAYGWAAYNVGSYDAQELTQLSRAENPNIRKTEEVIDLIKKKLKKSEINTVIRKKEEEFVEIPDQYLDASKIIGLGFRATTKLEEGLDRTIAWYKLHLNHLIKLGDQYLTN